jgi:DNA replication and repair protein RecF
VYVRWLELVGFRNYASLSFAPDPGLNVLVGPNGQGKTSLLEALHVLVAGRSFRTPRLAECVGWDGPEATVAGEIGQGAEVRRLRLSLIERGSGVELRGSLCSWARAVTFSAADLGLVAGGPAWRRAFLDGLTAKLVPAHAEACRRYRLAVQQRTRLLESLAGRADGERLLAPWDEQVAALGAEITQRRLESLAILATGVGAIWERLSSKGERVEVAYAATVELGTDREASRARLLGALRAGRADEMRRGGTLVGPHRDDVAVRLGRGEVRSGASRGEQRLLALTLRLAEADAVRRRLGTMPVFLLDDLLSDLDAEARARALGWLAEQGQVLFSAADPGGLGAEVSAVWEVRHGAVAAGAGLRARGAA